MIPAFYKITIDDFKGKIDTQTIWPGSVVGIKNGERKFLNRSIRFVQKHSLLDLDGDNITKEEAEFYAGFTHTGIVFNPDVMWENYRPHVKVRLWESLIGKEILIRRLKGTTSRETLEVCRTALDSYIRRDKYSKRELLGYYIRWAVHVGTAKIGFLPTVSFHKLFDDHEGDVCSTAVVRRYVEAGLMNDIDIWKWYPANLMYTNRFIDDKRYVIVQ